jgi:hypothetical protein
MGVRVTMAAFSSFQEAGSIASECETAEAGRPVTRAMSCKAAERKFA